MDLGLVFHADNHYPDNFGLYQPKPNTFGRE
jgi:hypothetical protein